MNPDIFEVIMLICWGAAWPCSIYRMWRTKQSLGKSPYFLTIALLGYISAILFKYFGEYNGVIFLYMFNALMVSVDLTLTIRYRKNHE